MQFVLLTLNLKLPHHTVKVNSAAQNPSKSQRILAGIFSKYVIIPAQRARQDPPQLVIGPRTNKLIEKRTCIKWTRSWAGIRWPWRRSPSCQLARDESETVEHFRQRPSVVLVRDNMQMLLSRAPEASPSQITWPCELLVDFTCESNIPVVEDLENCFVCWICLITQKF